MLDSDLAKLYKCKNGTKEINQAVKNNLIKFPDRFSWKLSNEESKDFLVKNFDQKIETRGGKYKNPRVFTEEGVAMLATIIKSKEAAEISIAIMDAFVKMRHFILGNYDFFKSLNNKLFEVDNKLNIHDERINKLFSKFETKEVLLLNGQIYDAYSKILDIFKLAKDELIIIDNYADNNVLDMISKLNCNITIITKDSNRISNLDIDKYNSQYNNLKVIRNNTFHDRYIIIDKRDIYHLGTSINNAGNGMFSINKLEDEDVINLLINKVNI